MPPCCDPSCHKVCRPAELSSKGLRAHFWRGREIQHPASHRPHCPLPSTPPRCPHAEWVAPKAEGQATHDWLTHAFLSIHSPLFSLICVFCFAPSSPPTHPPTHPPFLDASQCHGSQTWSAVFAGRQHPLRPRLKLRWRLPPGPPLRLHPPPPHLPPSPPPVRPSLPPRVSTRPGSAHGVICHWCAALLTARLCGRLESQRLVDLEWLWRWIRLCLVLCDGSSQR